jgi:hypothetical protein
MQPGRASQGDTRVGPKVSGLTYKSRAKWKMLRGIYSVIYGDVNVSVSIYVEIKGDCTEKYQSCFISVTFKSWSDRKLLDPPLCVCVCVYTLLFKNKNNYAYTYVHEQQNQ